MQHATQFCNNSPNRHFLAFYLLNKKFPGVGHGNRCGHKPRFNGIPAVKTNGQKLKIPRFLRKAENQAAYIFNLPYKFLFSKSPQIRAVHAQQTKTNVMRSELRESLLLFVQIVLRNYDLSTMQLAQSRTIPDLIHFSCAALASEERRLSAGRFYTARNFLELAGLVFCRKPAASKNENGEWRAEATEITFTKSFWSLLGIKETEISTVKNEALARNHKKKSAFIRANEEVLTRKFKNQLDAAERRNRAASARFDMPPLQSKTFEKEPPCPILVSKISTKLCLLHGIEIAREAVEQLKTKTAAQIRDYAHNLGIP